MAMTIKTTPELWGDDARSFIEESERNGKLSTPKLTDAQRKIVYTMWDSVKNTIFPPQKG